MPKVYVILDAVYGYWVDLVVWNGDTSVWQPPQGTVAKLADTVDFNTLPEFPAAPGDPQTQPTNPEPGI